MSFTAKILLLGSGELGKEFAIAAKRLGAYVVACDAYEGAPAMQVADAHEVFSMLDGARLREAAERHRPDYIVPEVEAIRTEELVALEAEGFTVVPSARATQMTMNRDAIRALAAETLGLRTSRYRFAESLKEVRAGAAHTGLPCVIKPVMSSSGKGQSTVRDAADLEAAWRYAVANMRGDRPRVIVEEFIPFDYEITLLTVRTKKLLPRTGRGTAAAGGGGGGPGESARGDVGPLHQPTAGPPPRSGEESSILFCPPIGHRQERGDYQESWQPMPMSPRALAEAQEMAAKVVDDLGGYGLFGVEFFIAGDEAIFSELSPRPHDTGMVTLISQNLSEFELHARAILGLPIPHIVLRAPSASAVILADREGDCFAYEGVADALALGSEQAEVDVRIFGKPVTRPNRRMAVALASADTVEEARRLAAQAAARVRITYS